MLVCGLLCAGTLAVFWPVRFHEFIVYDDQVYVVMTSSISCATGNPDTSNILMMTVKIPPVVTFTRCNDSITTTNAQPFRLKGGIPLGGTYSGPGVTNGYFYSTNVR